MPATPLPSADGALRDRHGRTAHDLRVSLTDRCNLRCSYCMPPEGLAWLPTDQMLTDAEVTRLCTLAVTHLGIHKIRFTGGEPLLRKGLESIVAACAGLRTDRGSSPELALTTNALGLAHRARALADAGLDRVNVSLDTLDREHFARITHRDRLPDVLAGIRAAQDAGLTPVKVNAVVTRAINAPDLPELFDFCLDNSLQLRVIEQMPIGPEGSWDRASMVSRAEILELLATRHQLAELSPPPTTGTLPAGALPDGMPPSTVQPEHPGPTTSAPHTAEPTVTEPTTAPSTRTHQPSCGRSTDAPTRRWASSPRSRPPSARPATARGSPATARCAPACSPPPRPTCAHCCAAGPPTPSLPTPGGPRCGPSHAPTASTSPGSPCRRAP